MSGKNLKIWGVRQSLIGDSIMALPILNILEDAYPRSYKYWQIARKCAQSAPIYYNHPLIDKIVISDCLEGMGPKDREIAATCNIVLNTTPNHPFEHDWPNYRNIFEETWVMAGLPLDAYHSLPREKQRPKLYQWWEWDRRPKTIAIWPCANYGTEAKRSPNQSWYNSLVTLLRSLGYKTIQCGHPRDFFINCDNDARDKTFFEQIQISLSCDLTIGTDSGAGLVIGAYEANQISLLTNHFTGHTKNLYAFGTNNPNNYSFLGEGDPNRIIIDEVANKVKEIIG